MSLAIGILFLILASAFAAQAYIFLTERRAIINLFLGSFAITVLVVIGALEAQHPHLGSESAFVHWIIILISFLLEILIGVIAFIAERDNDNPDPAVILSSIFPSLGAINALIIGVSTITFA
jgi:hypothetical protein